MSKGFYAKLAVSNMKKNRQFTVPYLLTGIFLVMMFYVLGALAANPDMEKISGSMLQVLNLGIYVVGIFSVILLFYADSFLMKRRKKELGLYNILGMEKKHIGRTLFWETVYAWLIAVAGGIVLGILFSKLIFLIAQNAFKMHTGLEFYVSTEKLLLTVVFFGLIYLVSFVFHMIQLKVNHPVELLKGANVGEREPKTKWVTAIAGIACLAIGYYLSLSIVSPLKALTTFFFAVLFVIAGTYLTFTAATIALLKILRKKKTFYYKTKHFTAVSGLIYRMKQNAVGLSSICILATCVLVLVSTTFSLYRGVESGVENDMLRNTAVEITGNKDLLESLPTDDVYEMVDDAGYEITNEVDFYYGEMIVLKDGDVFRADKEAFNDRNFRLAANVYLISADDYKILTGKNIQLKKGHVLAYASTGEQLKQVKMIDEDWIVDGEMDINGVPGIGDIIASYAFIVPDQETVWEISNEAARMYGDERPDYAGQLTHSIHFDTKGSEETQTACADELRKGVGEVLGENGGAYFYYVFGRAAEIADGYQTYGGFLFIGVFLAIVFMMGTVLIIYYKQMSEGFEDRERFQIMQKVGMSRKEVRQSIRSQILIVFFLPLVTAAVHIAAAFPMITKLLMCFNMTDTTMFGICTIVTLLAFAVIYAIVYSLTAKVYYKIVTIK